MSPVIEGAGQVNWGSYVTKERVSAFEFDFAVDGGAIGAITSRGQNALPSGAVVTSTIIKTVTPPTSGGSATIAVALESAGDVVAATAIGSAPWVAAGVKKGLINGGTDPLLLTAERKPVLTVAAAALTAGKVVVVVKYLAGVTN